MTRRLPRRLFLSGATLAAAAAVAACRRDEESATRALRDGAGDDAGPGGGGGAVRVVSLSPATTETLFALGAGARVVGRSRHCDTPPEAQALPVVGGYADPSLEAILALRPTLVAGARGPASEAIAQRLEARGLATYFPRTESVAEVQAMIQGLGARVARPREASLAITLMNARFRELADAVAAARERARARGAGGAATPPRVLFVFGKEPVVVAGPGSFPGELLERAGARNVVTEGGAYPTLGLERVALLDPDVVIDGSVPHEGAGEALSANRPGWRTVRAVREGRVALLRDASPLRPGPRLAEGAVVLARLLVPDLGLP